MIAVLLYAVQSESSISKKKRSNNFPDISLGIEVLPSCTAESEHLGNNLTFETMSWLTSLQIDVLIGSWIQKTVWTGLVVIENRFYMLSNQKINLETSQSARWFKIWTEVNMEVRFPTGVRMCPDVPPCSQSRTQSLLTPYGACSTKTKALERTGLKIRK